MASLATVFVAVKPETKDFEPDLKKKLAKVDASRAGKQVGKSFGGAFGKAFGVFAGGLFAGVGVVSLFSGFIADAKEAAKISRITAQAIESTGGAAKISAEQVADLSEALSNKTAIDDELIQSGANLLLTFKNIRNEAGKGNDIFNQATAAALDLSAAGFGSVESASKMLGKALNDPVRGLTALGRAGVTFTDQQKEQIKTLVEAGDVLGAQRIIMEEIASQVGGAAEAAADPLERLKVVAGNLGEEVGAFLLPHLENFSTWLIDEGIPQIKEIARTFRDEWLPPIKEVVGWIVRNKDVLIPLVAVIGSIIAAVRVWTVVQGILNLVLLANPVGLLIVALGALVAAIVLAWNESETFRDVVTGAWEGIKRAFEDGLRTTVNFMLEFAEAILDGAEAAFGWIPGIGDDLRGAQKNLEKFKKDVNRTLSQISDEEIKIKITASGLQRVATQSAAAAAARFQGVGGAGGLPPMRAFTGDDAQGGSLDFQTTGLDSARIGRLAGQIGDQAGHAAMAEMQRLFKAGLFVGPGGPGGFPLPRGAYRVGRGTTGHGYPAQDFPAATGTPIYAVRSGVVARALRLATSYGIHALLAHPGGWGSLYAHMSSMFVRAGQAVRSGQMIGRVGSTGNSTGPHLHFEARRGNARVNPRSLISYDSGGWLPPGLSLAYNGTGGSERVQPSDQPMRLHPADIRALGEAMGRVVLAGIGGAQHSAAQLANLYARSG